MSKPKNTYIETNEVNQDGAALPRLVHTDALIYHALQDTIEKIEVVQEMFNIHHHIACNPHG
jgi:hypothetical protein